MASKNIRIPLGGKKFLVSDGMSYFIVRQQKSEKTDEPYDVRLSGYCCDLEHLMTSYYNNTVMNSEAESLAELGRTMKKTRAEIRKWYRELTKA